MAVPLWKTISTLSNQLKNIILNLNVISPGWDCQLSCNTNDDIPSLEFPDLPSMQPMLLQLGLSESLTFHYQSIFMNSVQTIDDNLRQLYRTTIPDLCENPKSPASRLSYIEALRDGILNQRAQFVQKCWGHVLLIHEQSDHPSPISTVSTCSTSPSISSSSSSSSRSSCKARKGRPHMFTKEQNAVLQALLVHDDRYSSEEKELIANALGLTRDQVNRWFCNARARQKPYARPAKEHASSLQDTLHQYITSENDPDKVITNDAGRSRPTPSTNENYSEQSSNDSLNQDYIDTNICGVNTHDQNSIGDDFGSFDTNSSSPEHLDLFDQYFIFPMEDVHSDTWAQQPIFG